MSKAKKTTKKELRAQKQEEQAKMVIRGIAIVLAILVLLMFVWYAGKI